MARIELRKVLDGAVSLVNLYESADALGQGDGKVSKTDLAAILERTTDATAKAALTDVWAETRERVGRDPNVWDIRKVLGEATAAAAAADVNGSQSLSDGEQKSFDALQQKIFSFASKFANVPVKDIAPPPFVAPTDDELANMVYDRVKTISGPVDNNEDIKLSEIPEPARTKIEAAMGRSYERIPASDWDTELVRLYRSEDDDRTIGYAFSRTYWKDQNSLAYYQVKGFNLAGKTVYEDRDVYSP